MSQSPQNYMENVPVKISEQYKPPPKVSLPQSVCQRLNADENPTHRLNYDFSLEKNVLRRIDEWKKVRETDRDARRERIRKREIDRVKQNEEKQKQLLTAVSYPSAEELSSDDEEAEGSSGASNTTAATNPSQQQQQQQQAISAVVQRSPSQRQHQQRFDTILTPTIVPDAYNHVTYSNSMMKTSLSKINYSDFESDTSSPFDNIELKTINDLDILAQVLNVTQLHSTPTPNPDQDESHPIRSSHSPTNQPFTNNANKHHHHQLQQQPNQRQDLYQTTTNNDNCNAATGNDQSVGNIYGPLPVSSQNANHFYAAYNNPSVQNNVNMNGMVTNNDFYYYQNHPNHHHHQPNYDNYMYSNVNYSISPLSNQSQNTVMENVATTAADFQLYDSGASGGGCDATTTVAAPKSKSKSVPDILKELNAEIRDSEMRRTRNHSQNIDKCEKKPVNNAAVATTRQPRSETFMKLSPSSQSLATNISLMGFPLERVSRIAERFGNDDKKIVEHLIPLSELLDLGFDETRISDALLKFDNNKEKALDFLIS